jgi:hypothetical protein
MTRKKITGKGWTTAEDRLVWQACQRGVGAEEVAKQLTTRRVMDVEERMRLLAGMDQFCPTQYMIPARYRPDTPGTLPARLIAPTPERKSSKGEGGW